MATSEEALADMAYDAALRGQAVVARSVDVFRSQVVFVVTGGLVGIGLFANATLRATSLHLWLTIISTGSTICFLLLGMYVMRLRKSLALEIDPQGLTHLAKTDVASLRMTVAKQIAGYVKSSNSKLQEAQKELYQLIGLLAVTLCLWATTALLSL